MLRRGVKPSIVTYNLLIDYFCKGGDFSQAECVLNMMKEENIQPDVIIYNVIIDGYCKKGLLHKAFKWLDLMERGNCNPDTTTYNILIHGLIKRGYSKEARQIMDELVKRGLCPDKFTFASMIETNFKEGNFEDAYLIWCRMNENGRALQHRSHLQVVEVTEEQDVTVISARLHESRSDKGAINFLMPSSENKVILATIWSDSVLNLISSCRDMILHTSLQSYTLKIWPEEPDLIKTVEKRPREMMLRREFVNAVGYLNQILSEESHLKFIHWDFHKFAKSKSANVLAVLGVVASEALDLTGFYYSGKPAVVNVSEDAKPAEHPKPTLAPVPACKEDFTRMKLTSFDSLIEKTCSAIKNDLFPERYNSKVQTGSLAKESLKVDLAPKHHFLRMQIHLSEDFVLPSFSTFFRMTLLGVFAFFAEVLLARGFQLEKTCKVANIKFIEVFLMQIFGVRSQRVTSSLRRVVGSLLILVSFCSTIYWGPGDDVN
ncbi:hypothetical protein H6P81_015599 [Aristolochia fimbriata]|uniref:Pentatricopeptide repeat-containing protein n=1 Tax=Aristolochia fimbriata TaxID=158543 RepID=A0AAV7E673_ARIFI|nr:hypothetical protein H6P81_015599 [Aristolochia fimbriata]